VKPFEFKPTLSGELSRPGPSRLVAGIIGGEGFEFEGPFELKASSAGNGTKFEGNWRSKTDLRLDPGSGTLAATGIALATFANAGAGQVCLAFEQTFVGERHGSTHRLTGAGTFTLLGGNGEAARLLGAGDYRIKVGNEGALTYQGRSRPAGEVPAMPAECLALTGS
jgi:hypothetical protein